MTEPITLEQLKNASLDAKTLEQVINGDDNTDVTSRLGATYPTLDKALRLIMQNGMISTTAYKTHDEMVRSALPDDSYVVVTNDPDIGKNGLWQKINGQWQYSKLNTVPHIMTEINKILHLDVDYYDDNGRKIAWGVVDDTDQLGAYVADDGTINASNISSDPNAQYAWAVVDDDNSMAVGVLKDGSFAIGNGLSIHTADSFVFAVTDDDGRAIFAVDKQGHIVSPDNLRVQQAIDDAKNAMMDSDKPIELQKTDYLQLIGYGQSLSRGAGGFPIISTVQPYNNVMFKSGVLRRYMDEHDFSDFVPLVEADDGNWEGETPMSAMANHTVKMLVADGKKAGDWQFVATSSGMGGQPIEVLSKGQPLYDGMLEQLKAGVVVANTKNKSYSTWAITWTQGEDNYARNTPKHEYKQLLKQLHDDITADAKAITGQRFAPVMVMYQTAAHRRYNKDDNPIAIAQHECCNEYANMIMATPIYHLPHDSDNLHLTGDSSHQLGLYYAKALKYVIDNKTKWQPLQPKHILAQGTLIDIEFSRSGLVLDTTQVTKTHNFGFDLFDANNNIIDIISQVRLVGSNRVQLILSAPIPPNTWLSYAKGRKGDPNVAGNTTGARGNLRDNDDPTGYTDSQNNKRHLHNWCVMFTSQVN